MPTMDSQRADAAVSVPTVSGAGASADILEPLICSHTF
jgi:hypothetical protein